MTLDRLTASLIGTFAQIGLGFTAFITGLLVERNNVATVCCGVAVSVAGILGVVGIYKVHRVLLISVLLINIFATVILLELSVAFIIQLKCLVSI